MKRIWILAFIVVFGCLGNYAFGQKVMAMKNVVKNGYNFWVYEPGDSLDKGEKQPLIIFLHGASLKGNDLHKVLKYGPLNAIDRGIKVNAYVVAPQTSDNWNADKIWKCVEWVTEHYPIDTNRISVVGMSLGGFGTFTLATKYYDKLSAGMMLCGGNTNENYCGLTRMPFWIMHGTADRAVPITRSNSIVNAMAACGDTSRLIYTVLQSANHGYPAKLFYLTETYDWLTSHSLTDENRAVNREIKIPQSTISAAYGRLTGVTGAAKLVYNVPTEEKTDEDNATSVPAAEPEAAPEANESAAPVKAEAKSAVSPQSKQPDHWPWDDEPVQEKKVEVKSDAANSSAAKNNTAKNEDDSGEIPYYVVQPGNTLTQIAAKFNTTVERLCELNGLEKGSTLQIGQRLKVGYSPAKGGDATANASRTSEKKQTAVQSKPKPTYHKVVSGDTLSRIAKKYHTTVKKLCELNGISETSILQIGQKIKLPTGK